MFQNNIAETVEKKVGKGIHCNEIMSGVIDDANRRNVYGENSNEIYSSLIQMYKLQRAPGFQITGDNVELQEKQNICQCTNKIKVYSGSIWMQ